VQARSKQTQQPESLKRKGKNPPEQQSLKSDSMRGEKGGPKGRASPKYRKVVRGDALALLD